MALQEQREVTALATLKRGMDGRTAPLLSLGSLYVSGFDVDWDKVHPTGGRVVSLPSYPWQRERFWAEEMSDSLDQLPGARRRRTGSRHPFLESYWQPADQPGVHCWEAELDTAKFPYLTDHALQGAPILPAAVYLEMALAASSEIHGAGPRVFRNFALLSPVFLPPGKRAKVQLMISPDGATASQSAVLCV